MSDKLKIGYNEAWTFSLGLLDTHCIKNQYKKHFVVQSEKQSLNMISNFHKSIELVLSGSMPNPDTNKKELWEHEFKNRRLIF